MRVSVRRAGAVVAALLLAVSTAGCAGRDGSGDEILVAESPGPSVVATEAEPSATGTPADAAQGLGAAPSPSRSPSRSPSSSPRPSPSRKPPVETKLPPPPPPPPPAGCKPRYEGTQATRAEAKQALTDAAGRTYWPTSAPSIKVPLNMVKAVAWQESGWQSNIIACDGGVGLMQVMQPTADFVNNRFGKSYDINDYRDNASLGANYLAWLIKYFGDVYFAGDYTLYTDGECASHTAPCLINAVLASYNYGFGAVDTEQGIVIPNARYVENVRALMTNCQCLSF